MRPPEAVPSGRIVRQHRQTPCGEDGDLRFSSAIHGLEPNEVGMLAKSEPRAERERAESGWQFYYRRTLSGRDLLPAIGVGIAAGILAFYVSRIYLQRTPLVPAGKSGGADAGAGRRARVPIPKRGG